MISDRCDHGVGTLSNYEDLTLEMSLLVEENYGR